MTITTPPTDLPHAHGLVKARVGVLPAPLFAPGIAAANDAQAGIPDFVALLESALEQDGTPLPSPAEFGDPAKPELAEAPNAAASTALEALAAAAALPNAAPPAAQSLPQTPASEAEALSALPPAAPRSKNAETKVFAAEPPAGPALEASAGRNVPAAAAAPAWNARPEQAQAVAQHAVPEHAAPALAAPPALVSALPSHATELHVGPRVGVPGFHEAFAARVSIAVRSGNETASITLNPPELGPVSMQIDVSGSEARVAFAADHPLTREAIAEALPRLREMLATHGLELAGSSVGTELPRRDPPAQPAGTTGARGTHDEPDAGEQHAESGVAVVPRLVDTFA